MLKNHFLILFFVCATDCTAQSVENVFGDTEDSLYTEEQQEPITIQPDTVLIKNSRITPADSILVLKKRKEFAYVPLMDSLLKAQPSQGERKARTSLSWFERFLHSAFFRFFIWLIPTGLVLLVLYNFLKTRGSFTKRKKSDVHEDYEDDVQNTTQDYLKLARDAANSGNYRPAVKYLFLRTLQQLAAQGLINYASDKTNYNYLQEISADKRKEFARLVMNYEYVWYGNAIPEGPAYTQIENEFKTFLDKYNLN